jgi:hypothetical protein
MIKHVGRHGQDKVVVVFNTVPNEDHMALVVYSDRLPLMLHDEVMRVLESKVGQQEKNLADALFRHVMPDGTNTLGALHSGGFMKKVQTSQVILQPNARTNVRLDEINNILKKMEGGEEAVRQLAEVEAGRGYADNKYLDQPRDMGEPNLPQQDTSLRTSSDDMASSDVLSNADLAKSRLVQAENFRSQAHGLLEEAKRLESEAKALTPKAKNVRKSATKEEA